MPKYHGESELGDAASVLLLTDSVGAITELVSPELGSSTFFFGVRSEG